MQQVVLPIKDSNVLKEVQDTLLNNFRTIALKVVTLRNKK